MAVADSTSRGGSWMKVRPLRDRIAVTKEKPETAKVVALGNGVNDTDEVFLLDGTMASTIAARAM